MSLINEALKRAEQDKRRNDACEAPMPIPVPATRSGGSGALKWVVLAGAIAAAAAAVWYALPTGPADAPARAVARSTPEEHPAEPRQVSPVAVEKPKPSPEVKPVRVSPEAELAFAMTLEAMEYCPEPELLPPGPADAGPKQAPPAPAAPEPAAKQPASKFDPNRLHLSGVMHSLDGGTAIINGAFVKVGQSIDGATVIRIDQYTVELEADGQRFFIRM